MSAPAIDRAAVLKAVDDEPELPGEIPPDMWHALQGAALIGDQAFISEALRIAVRQTKQGIRERLEAIWHQPCERDDEIRALLKDALESELAKCRMSAIREVPGGTFRRRALAAHYEKHIERLEGALRTIAESRTMDVGEIRRLASATLAYFKQKVSGPSRLNVLEALQHNQRRRK